MRFSRRPSIPVTNRGLLDWANNWLDQMGVAGANFADFGLAAAPTGFDALRTAYVNAYNANLYPNTTPATVNALKIAKLDLLNYVRPIANQISGFPEGPAAAGVCPREAKIELRVNPRFNSKAVAGVNAEPRTPNDKPPTAIPEFDVKPVDNLTIKIRSHFGGAPLRTGSSKLRSVQMPDGVRMTQYYYKLTAPVPGRNAYEGMVPMATSTRGIFKFTFDPSIGGRQVYIAAKYVSTRGLLGEFSSIKSTTVVIQGVQITNVPTTV